MNSKILKDLERSGLTKEDAEEMKLSYLTDTSCQKLTKIKAEGYRIPYFDISGKITKFYRVRLLTAPKGRFASSLSKKPLRYTQPEKTDPHLYFPPNLDWKIAAKDTEIPIVITEGEKKAYAACKKEVYCIGLGGVWAFRYRRAALLPEFSSIEWLRREVVVVYDSDLRSNGNVQHAMLALAKELTQLGANVIMYYLPDAADGAKQGLDDYLLHHSMDYLYENLPFDRYQLGKELWEMNQNIAVLKNPAAIYHFETRSVLTRKDITSLVYADKNMKVPISEDKMKSVNIAEEWMKWPQRRVHDGLVYAPGKGEVFENSINTWKGWGCTPKKGDIKPWKELMKYMFQEDLELLKWFERWLAYPLQNPGTKMHTSVLIHGLLQGTGKSFIGVIMSRIYGSNYASINQENLESNFTEWAHNKQFIMGEEITGTDKRRDTDRIKHIITRELIEINIKYRPSYYLRDCINYYFTSQHPDAMFLEHSDRRFMVHEAPMVKMSDEFYTMVDKWNNSAEGPAALFHYLLNEVDCANFGPKSAAPNSKAKQEMQDISMSDLDMFCSMLRSHPDTVLRWGDMALDRDLYTVGELLAIYDRDSTRHTTHIAMSKALRRAGFKPLGMAAIDSKTTKKLWAARNIQKWIRSGHKDWVDHYKTGKIHIPSG